MAQPSIDELRQSIKTDIEISLSTTASILPKSFILILANTFSAIFIILYKYAGFVALQLFVNTASFEETEINGETIVPLIEWGRLIGVSDPTAPTKAKFIVEVTVVNQTGTLPVGTQLQSNFNGFIYSTTEEITLDAPTKLVNVEALNDPDNEGGLGINGNLDVGSILSFITPLFDVSRETIVDSIVENAIAGESEEGYRRRVKLRFSQRPQGGAYIDYVQWGLEAAGIANIYVFTGSNGVVDIYVESGVEADGIATPTEIQAVTDLINLDEDGKPSRKPINTFINVVSISRKSFDVQILGLNTTNTDDVKASILDAFNSYFLNAENFIIGISPLPRQDRISASSLNSIVNDIVQSDGGEYTGLNLIAPPSLQGVSQHSLAEGEKAKLLSLTYL